MQKLFIVVTAALSLTLSGCSGKSPESRQEKGSKSGQKLVHTAADSKGDVVKFMDVLKTKSLPAYPSVTIGGALDSYPYFTRHEWSEIRANNGKIYIDCIGWFDGKALDAATLGRGVTAQGLAVKFVITTDGTFGLVMISKLESGVDGKVSSEPLEDLKGFAERLFGKKEIRF